MEELDVLLQSSVFNRKSILTQPRSWREEDIEQRILENARYLWDRFLRESRLALVRLFNRGWRHTTHFRECVDGQRCHALRAAVIFGAAMGCFAQGASRLSPLPPNLR